jgi:hypothetical protein
MAISQYWVGQIPAAPLVITVHDSNGNPASLATSTAFTARMIDADDKDVDLTGSVLLTSGAIDGRFVFRWPTDRSLFTDPGEYLFQLEIDGAGGSKDFTTEHHIKVRRLGGK